MHTRHTHAFSNIACFVHHIFTIKSGLASPLFSIATLLSQHTTLSQTTWKMSGKGVAVPEEVIKCLESSEKLSKVVRQCKDEGIHLEGYDFSGVNNTVRIVLTGPQSAGKSSLLDAMLGFPFSLILSGTGTRRPIHLVCETKPEGDEEFSVGGTSYASRSEMQAAVKAANGSVFSEEKLDVRICSKHVPNIAVVDLPGLRSVGEANELELIKKITKDHLAEESNYIVCVIGAPNDAASWGELNDTMGPFLKANAGWEKRVIIIANRFNLRMNENKTPALWNEYFQNMRNSGTVFVTTLGYSKDKLSEESWQEDLGTVQERDSKYLKDFMDSNNLLHNSDWDKANCEMMGLDRILARINDLLREGALSKAQHNLRDANELTKDLKASQQRIQDQLAANTEEQIISLMERYAKELATHLLALHDNRSIDDNSRYTKNEFASPPRKKYTPSHLPENLKCSFWDDMEKVSCDSNILIPHKQAEKKMSSQELKDRLNMETAGKENAERVLIMAQWYILSAKVEKVTREDIWASATNQQRRPDVNKLVCSGARNRVAELGDIVIPWMAEMLHQMEVTYYNFVEGHLLSEEGSFARMANPEAVSFHEALRDAIFNTVLRSKTKSFAERFGKEVNNCRKFMSLNAVEREMLGTFMGNGNNAIVIPQEPAKYEPSEQLQAAFKDPATKLQASGSAVQAEKKTDFENNERRAAVLSLLRVGDSSQSIVSKQINADDWVLSGNLSAINRALVEVTPDYVENMSQRLYESSARYVCSWLEMEYFANVMPLFTEDNDNTIIGEVNSAATKFIQAHREHLLPMFGVDDDKLRNQLELLESALKAALHHSSVQTALLASATARKAR